MRSGAAGVSFRVQRVRRRRTPTGRTPAWLRRGPAFRSTRRKLLLMLGVVALIAVFTVISGQAGGPVALAADKASFNCTTGSGTYTVPVGTTELDVQVAGAHGSGGGGGAVVFVVIPVHAGQTIGVSLGCGQNGFTNGGSSGSTGNCSDGAGAGGGSTALTTGPGTQVLVQAGGGGGAGGGNGGCGGRGSGGAGSQQGDDGTGGGSTSPGGGGHGGNVNGPGGDGGDRGGRLNLQGGGGGGGGGCLSGSGGGGASNVGNAGGGGGGGGGSSCVGGSVSSTVFQGGGNGGDGFVTIDPVSLAVTVTGAYTDSNNDGVQNAGDTIVYTIVTTNNSSVALDDVNVTATTDGGVPLSLSACPAQTVQPNGSVTCLADYTLVLKDLDRGAVNVSATATGQLPALPGQDTTLAATGTGTTSTTLTDSPKLTLSNIVTGLDDQNNNGLNDAGDLINYQVQVVNAGNSTVSGIAVTEFAAGATANDVPLTCDVASIVPEKSVTCTGSYTIVSSDVDTPAATIKATANASGTSRAGIGQAVKAASATVTTRLTQHPELTTQFARPVLTDANNDSRTDAGDTIAYSATVTNSGTVTLTGVGVTLTIAAPGGPAPDLDCSPSTPATLAPGGQLACTATYTITQPDVDNSEVAATVAASGLSGTTKVNADAATATTKLQQNSGITAVPSVSGVDDRNGDGKLEAGDTVRYSVAVTNTGTVSLNQVSVTGQLASPAAPDPTLTCSPKQPGKLVAGDVMTCTGAYTVTQPDVDKGSLALTVTATGLSPAQESVTSDPGTVTTPLGAVPAMSITNTVTGVADSNHNSVNDTGDVISYSVATTNTGTVTLTAVAITDQLAPPAAPALSLQCSADAPVTLAPGDTLTCTASYTITQADVDRGTVLATATTGAKTTENNAVSAGPLAVTTKLATTAILVARNLVTSIEDRNSDTVDDEGDVIVYSVTLTNKGSVSLGDVTAVESLSRPADDSPSLTCDPTAPGTLAPAAAMTCTGSYRITAADARKGGVKATAAGTGGTAGGTQVRSASSIVVTPVHPLPPGVKPAPGGSSGGSAAGATHRATKTSSGAGRGKLAFTGFEAAPVVLGGALCLVVGAGLVLLTVRRRRHR
jgi:uncharacterized repeat protein (TIGR01451 family)